MEDENAKTVESSMSQFGNDNEESINNSELNLTLNDENEYNPPIEVIEDNFQVETELFESLQDVPNQDVPNQDVPNQDVDILAEIDSDLEDWGVYDENEGVELEEALDHDIKLMEQDVEEFESFYSPYVEFEEPLNEFDGTSSQTLDKEVSTAEGELITVSQKLQELTLDAVKASTSKVHQSTKVDGHPSIPSLAFGIAGYRQDGLFDIQREFSSFCSDSTSSEMTWPRTIPSDAEAGKIERSVHSGESQLDSHSDTSDTESPLVLEADNIMMDKFQNILKNHLLMQINRIKDQIQDIDSERKRISDESKQQADSVYREDRFVKQQRADIESYKINLEQAQCRRESLEKGLDNLRSAHKQMKQLYLQTNRYDDVLIKERELQNDLLQKMRAYEAEKLQHLKLSEVASKNLQSEKKKLTEEKMKQDMILWTLEKEIIRLNNEIELSASNCEEMQEETNCLNKLLQKIDEDSLATEAEGKILQSTLVKIYTTLKELDSKKYAGEQNLEALINKYNLVAKNKIYWVNQLKKECFDLENLESQKSDLLLVLDHQRNKKNIIRTVEDNLQVLCQSADSLIKFILAYISNYNCPKKVNRKRTLINLEQLIQLMEREVEKKYISLTLYENDFKKFEKEEICLLKFKHNLELELSNKVTEMEKLKKTLNDLFNEEQVSKKGLGYLQTEIRKLGELNHQTEERIVDSELRIAKLLLEVEKARNSLFQFTSDLDNTLKASKEIEGEMKEATTLQRRLKSKMSVLISKQQVLERQIAHKNKANPENTDASPTTWAETKLKRMQGVFKSMSELTQKLSNGWFNLQNIIMKRKDDRARQIHQLNIKRKHCHTVDACRLRIERNLANVTLTINQFKKDVSKEQRYFERWQCEKFKAFEKLDKLKSINTELETRFVDDVSEAEKEGKLIEGEIYKTKSDIEDLSTEVSRLQAELLEMEKKRDLAGIAKEKIEEFQAPSGEIGQLKQEIHRMEVRHSHLKKAQEKLMLDLEQCISRRDRVIDNAEAREIRSQTTGKNWSREQIQRKMDDLKNKIQSLKRKNAIMHKDQLELSYQLAEAREEYDCMRGKIEDLRNSLQQLEGQMEEGLLHKHACLETTAYRQRKAKLLEDLKFNRYKHLYKTAGSLAAEEEKQQRLMNALQSVLENVLNDFPRLHLQIAQIMNTLQPVIPETWETPK